MVKNIFLNLGEPKEQPAKPSKLSEKLYTRQKSAPTGHALKAAESMMSLASVGASLTGQTLFNRVYEF